jgi:tetratricopeptide (TPR) repeat protein
MQAAAEMELALATPSESRRLEDIRQTFLELARFHEHRRERFDQALALNNSGLADYYAGHVDSAIETYRGVLPIYTRLGEKSREAVARQNIAVTEFDLGRFSAAKRDFARALSFMSEPTSSLRGQILNNEALAEMASGDLDAALEHHGAALTILTSLQLDREEARALHGIGTVYYAAGDKTQALEYFSRALALRDAARDPRGRMASLRAKASVLSDSNRHAEALAAREEALALAVAPSTRVRIETQLAKDLESVGRVAEARSMADRAVQEVDSGNSARALALLTRAELKYDAGELSDAESDADDALELLKVTETPGDQFRGWLLVAQIAQARHDDGRARQFVDRALELAEDIRVQSANPELRAGVWQSLKPAFDLKIELSAQDGSAGPALQTLATAETSRARSLADYQRLHETATREGGTSSRRLDELYREIADRRFELETRRDRAGDQDSRARAIQADIAALLREIDSQHHVDRGAVSSGLPPIS